MTTRSATIALSAVVAMTIAGCGGGSTPHVETPGHGSVRTEQPTSPAPPSTTTSFLPRTLRTVPLGRWAGPAALAGRTLTFTAASGGTGNWDQVFAVDLDSGQRVDVAHTDFADGLINWVAAASGWIVYVDQSARQSNADPKVLWRVIAVQLDTDHRVVLSSNGDQPDPYVPIVQSEGSYVFWTQAEADRSARELLWRPGWDEPRDVLRHTEMTPGSASVDSDHLVYLGPAATAAKGHTTGGDCWRVPLTGGTPQALTHTALAMSCAAADGALVWTLHIDPATKDQPSDGILDDAYELWAQPPHAGPELLHRGYIPLIPPSVGAGYVAWQTYARRLVVQSLADPSRQATVPGKAVEQSLIEGGTLVDLSGRGRSATAKVIALDPLPAD